MKKVLGALAALTMVAAAAPAAAQANGCAGGYTVRPGDTLAGIASRCGTTVSALTRANGFIRNPAQIEVGWRLAMPGAGQGGAFSPGPVLPAQVTPAPQPYPQGYGQTYRVQPGDSFSTIAQALGFSLAEILAQNGGIDPQALVEGMLLRLPVAAHDRRYDPRWDDDFYDDDRRPRLKLKPDEGRRGERVEVRLRDLRPRERVFLKLVEEDGRTVSLGRERADRDGRIKTQIVVPDWASPRRDLLVVAERRNGELVASEPFEVEGRRKAKKREDKKPRRLEGWIVRGVECPVLRTRGGKSFSLVSDGPRLPLGSYVEMTARKVDMSYCQEGAATFEVGSVRRIDPPR